MQPHDHPPEMFPAREMLVRRPELTELENPVDNWPQSGYGQCPIERFEHAA